MLVQGLAYLKLLKQIPHSRLLQVIQLPWNMVIALPKQSLYQTAIRSRFHLTLDPYVRLEQ